MRNVYIYGIVSSVLCHCGATYWNTIRKWFGCLSWYGLILYGPYSNVLLATETTCMCMCTMWAGLVCNGTFYFVHEEPRASFSPYTIKWKSIFYYVYAIFLIEFLFLTMRTRNIQKQIIMAFERHEWDHILLMYAMLSCQMKKNGVHKVLHTHSLAVVQHFRLLSIHLNRLQSGASKFLLNLLYENATMMNLQFRLK